MAGWTRLELATFCVTGRRSNQLSYHPEVGEPANVLTARKRVKHGFDLVASGHKSYRFAAV